MKKPAEGTLSFVKFSRAISYVVYGFVVVAIVSLVFAFFLLLFGASTSAPFVRFVYRVAHEFMYPFRGIFPSHQVGETGYLSVAALFAIIAYLFLGAALQSLIAYINLKMAQLEKEMQVVETATAKTAKITRTE